MAPTTGTTPVAPIVDVEPDSAGDLASARAQSAKVRDMLRGAADLNKRLSGESDESEQERLSERPVKGEAFMVKMLERRRRRQPRA